MVGNTHAYSPILTSDDGYLNILWLHAPARAYSPSLPVVVSKINGVCVTEREWLKDLAENQQQ